MPSGASDMLELAADFPAASEADWRKLVDGVLKGAPFEKLVGRTYDGLAIQPIYSRARAAAPVAGRAEGMPWQVMQRIDHPDAKQANAQALHDLENGANGLTLVFADANAARGFGIAPRGDAIAQTLDGIFLDAGISIDLEPGPQSRAAAIAFGDRIRTSGTGPDGCDIRFGLDPIGDAAVAGSHPQSWPTAGATLARDVKALKAMGFRGPFVAADGRVVHNAGGSEAQELAYVLAAGVAYLRALEAGGVAVEDARSMVYARLSADANQFLTMAKFRALRHLWARVEESCGLAPKPWFISADTAWRMLTQRDPSVNMLRATMATFAAGIVGADAVTVLPHTLALGLPDALARRVARNTQLVLIEESNIAKVGDPAAGSGGIESLTQQLCDSAWTLFQEIEKAGGIVAALEQTMLQQKVATVRAARESGIARRKDVLTGASEFPNLHETPASVLTVNPDPSSISRKPEITFEPLAPMRLAEPFEALRDKSDAILAKTKARPKVLLATLGTPADYTARATFAKSFFETGGIEAVEYLPALSSPLPSGERSTGAAQRSRSGEGAPVQDQIPSPAPSHSAQDRPLPMGEVKQEHAPLADAYKASGAALVCLCSSDKIYAAKAAEAAKALHAAGAKHIYLAGRPGELEAPLRAAGVADFIFAGGDALAMLKMAYGLLDQ